MIETFRGELPERVGNILKLMKDIYEKSTAKIILNDGRVCSFSAMIIIKARMPAATISISHCTRGPCQFNKKIKSKKM